MPFPAFSRSQVLGRKSCPSQSRRRTQVLPLSARLLEAASLSLPSRLCSCTTHHSGGNVAEAWSPAGPVYAPEPYWKDSKNAPPEGKEPEGTVHARPQYYNR